MDNTDINTAVNAKPVTDVKGNNAGTPPGKPKNNAVGRMLVGNGCILLASIFWGVNVAVTKALIPDWMSANGISFVRLCGGALLFWITSIFLKTERIEKGDWLKLLVGGMVGLFLFIYLFVTSLRYGSPIDISIIMTLPPVFVVLIGVLFQKRRPSWIECLGIIVSFAGAAIVILDTPGGKSGSNNLMGDLLAIASTICYAIYLVILEKPTQKYRPVNMLRWVFLFASVPALLLLPGLQHMPILHTTNAIPWVEIAFILLCPTFLAYFLVQPAVKSIGSELVSLYQYLLPVFATLTAVIMGLDKLKWMQVVAMAIIVGGMVLTNIGKRRRKTA